MASEPFGPVIVGVDQATSMAAVELAAEEAMARVAPLVVAHVHNGPQAAPYRLVEVAAARARAEHPGLSVSTALVTGDPVDELIGAANRASLLVLDRPDRHGSSGLPLDSVAAAVLRRSSVPVMLYAPLDHTFVAAVPRPVVLGVGDSPASDAAVEFAFNEAAIRGVTLHAVHVWSAAAESGPSWGPPDSNGLTQTRTSAEFTLDDTLTRWMDKYPDVRVRRALRHSLDVAVALTAASRSGQLLVVGASRSSGSLIQALVHRVGCPLALVPVDDPGAALGPDHR
jgi:nucleotide-binding universal stress UspA family protein